MSTSWPILDFSCFRNQMISGLSLTEINEILNPTEPFLDDHIDSRNTAIPISSEVSDYSLPDPLNDNYIAFQHPVQPVASNFGAPVPDDVIAVKKVESIPMGTSLRATCATRLYEHGVDEQLIMERTGHRSEKGVRVYKRTQEVHHHNTSVVIDNKCQAKYSKSSLQSTNGGNAFQFHFHAGCNVVIQNNSNDNE